VGEVLTRFSPVQPFAETEEAAPPGPYEIQRLEQPMAVKINKGRARTFLDMTPLIDIVFLLLIFFMVMTRFDEEDYKLDVVLPSASEAQPLMAKPREIFINIDEQGQFFVRGNQMSLEALEEMLEQAGADNPSGSVVIRADKNGRLEYSVLVMNACNKAGLTNYSISTAPVDPS